jgi:hypothetical protein
LDVASNPKVKGNIISIVYLLARFIPWLFAS